MSDLQTSKITRNAISSPASVDGATRCGRQIGPIIEKFGLEAVLANLSPSRAKEVDLLTTGISGHFGDISSRSDALQQSLESRLRARLNGSDLCEVIWKPWNTPWGQCLSRPRARVRTICATDSGLWPTARAHKWGPPDSHGNLAMWSTIRANDGEKGGPNMKFGAGGTPLPTMAAWATPRASPNENRTTKATPAQLSGKHGQYLAVQALTAIYPTPSASGFEAKNPKRLLERRAECKERTGNGNGFGLTLGQFACLNTNGSSEPTEKRGALNPEFVCWLMGYPTEWVNCAGSETRLTRARRRPSSKA